MGGMLDAIQTMTTLEHPEGAAMVNTLQNQGNMRSVLQSLADQQNGEAAQQIDGKGNVQDMPPALRKLLLQQASNAQQLGMASPSPENVQAAQGASTALSDPYYSMKLIMGLQKQKADIANTEAEAAKNRTAIVDTPQGKTLVNLDTGDQAHVGERIYASPEVQKLHDLTKFSQSITPQEATAQPGDQQGHSVNDLITAAYRTPDQQAAASTKATEVAKAQQEADYDVINTGAATSQLIPALNQLDSLNSNPELPNILPEEASAASNFLHKITLTNGKTADLYKQWEQTNSSKLVGGIKSFVASGTGTRMDLPIAHALMDANGIALEGTASGRADRIQQARIELYNSNIIAKNRAAQYKDPNAKPLPTIPLNFKGKIYHMSEIQNAAAAKKMAVDQALKKVQAAGGLVVQ